MLADANVVVTKTASDASPVAGADLTYSLNVTNHGPSVALDLRVRDDLPTGVDVLYVEDSVCSVSAGNVVRCDIGDLAAGATYDDGDPRPPRRTTWSAAARCRTRRSPAGTRTTILAPALAAARPRAARPNADVTVDCESDLWRAQVREAGRRGARGRGPDVLR